MKTLRFLAENHDKDSREWFAAHRSAYTDSVERPMLELAETLAPAMLRLDPLLIVEPRRVLSRIWRDVRFSRDKSVYKRASWIIFKRSKGMTDPGWFFEITPDFYRYGCGHYATPARVMAAIRQLVLADDPAWLAAREAVSALPGFALYGDSYKKPRYPRARQDQRDWLERRSLAAMRTSTDFKGLFSGNLAETLARAFAALAPLYALLRR